MGVTYTFRFGLQLFEAVQSLEAERFNRLEPMAFDLEHGSWLDFDHMVRDSTGENQGRQGKM